MTTVMNRTLKYNKKKQETNKQTQACSFLFQEKI